MTNRSENLRREATDDVTLGELDLMFVYGATDFTEFKDRIRAEVDRVRVRRRGIEQAARW